MENALPIPRLLELQGMGRELAYTLSGELGPCLDASTLAPELARRLEMILPFDSSWSGSPEVWPLIGSRGSGKTSVAAGLAAWSVLAYGARVVLIERKAEAVRGSGLREWSRKIGCEYVSLTDTEARQGIVPLRLSLNHDLILVDGISRLHPAVRKGLCGWRIRRHIVLDAGQLCSLSHLEHLACIAHGIREQYRHPARDGRANREFRAVCERREADIVLSAAEIGASRKTATEGCFSTNKEETNLHCGEQCRLRGARLIFTKLDKVSDLGSAITLAHKSSLPLAFFRNRCSHA